jgi:hypothetical protein
VPLAASPTFSGQSDSSTGLDISAIDRFGDIRLMKRRPTSICAVFALLFVYQPGAAAPVLTVSASANTTTVELGHSISFDVELLGLAPDQRLDSLAATVTYDEILLGPPTVTAGPIFPHPLDDPLDLLVSTGAGHVDVAFLTFGMGAADHIRANGTFFSFEAPTIAPGVVNIAVEFVGATLFNSANPNDPLPLIVASGLPLSLVIVPEPATKVVACVSVFLLAHWRIGRKRRLYFSA